MSIGDKVVTILMGVCIVCALSTLVSYVLYVAFDIGEAYFSIVFFICAMLGAFSLIGLGVIILNAKPNEGVEK